LARGQRRTAEKRDKFASLILDRASARRRRSRRRARPRAHLRSSARAARCASRLSAAETACSRDGFAGAAAARTSIRPIAMLTTVVLSGAALARIARPGWRRSGSAIGGRGRCAARAFMLGGRRDQRSVVVTARGRRRCAHLRRRTRAGGAAAAGRRARRRGGELGGACSSARRRRPARSRRLPSPGPSAFPARAPRSSRRIGDTAGATRRRAFALRRSSVPRADDESRPPHNLAAEHGERRGRVGARRLHLRDEAAQVLIPGQLHVRRGRRRWRAPNLSLHSIRRRTPEASTSSSEPRQRSSTSSKETPAASNGALPLSHPIREVNLEVRQRLRFGHQRLRDVQVVAGEAAAVASTLLYLTAVVLIQPTTAARSRLARSPRAHRPVAGDERHRPRRRPDAMELRGVDGELVELPHRSHAQTVEPIAECRRRISSMQRVALAVESCASVRRSSPVTGAQQREHSFDLMLVRPRPTRRAARRSKGCAAPAVTKWAAQYLSVGGFGDAQSRSQLRSRA